MKASRREVVSRFPNWCDGVLIVPYVEGGEISDYLIYPVKKSRGEDSYYYSDKWRGIKIPYIIELYDLAPCILLKSGEIYRVKKVWGSGKYRYIDTYRLVGKLLESGEIESEI